MKRRHLLSFLAMLVCTLAWCAAPTSGKYYRIENVNQNGYVMTENYQNGTMTGAQYDESKKYQQLWYWNGYALQNVYTAHYVQAQTQRSSQFKTGTDVGSNISATSMTDGHILLKCGGNTLHLDASHNIVKWEDDNNENSHWTFQEVTLTEEEINAVRNEYKAYEKSEKEFNTQLTNLQKANYAGLSTFFTDNACSALKDSYKSMSDDALKAAMADASLPEAIQNIAVKIKNGWSDETDASMSAQFRVQDYAAYSAAGLWRWDNNGAMGLNASQLNDMCNPTGVYTTGRDILFVFVDGDVPAGCSLRLSSVDEGVSGFGYNNYDNGTVLKKGINIIGAETSLREYWVMYTVTDRAKKPADMPKLKIHIEGGHVLGYVNVQNKTEEQANAEYAKVLKGANASAMASRADKCRLRLAVKGNYGMFYFQIMCYNRIWSDGNAELLKNNPEVVSTFESENWTSNYKQGFKIWKSMKFYDDVLMREWGMMGFMKHVSEATKEKPFEHLYGGEDLYPTYCNNLAYAIMGTAGGNPHSSTGYTHMPGVGAVESSYNGERKDFDTWCVGHESGHNNQGSINLESSTESSNNLFSNVITYLYGYRMSRGGTFMENQAYSTENKVFSWRDIGMTMRMYYNLYLYYHRAGYKQDFYPTLFYNLRRDPIKLGNTARTSWLHFYKKACEAAQEDLTEYFRLWGFFIPVDNGEFGDYTTRFVTCTQQDIDEAIAWVKAKGWPENKSIMFIEDRLKPVERTDVWANAGDIRPDNSGTMRTAAYIQEAYGNLGHFTDYMAGNIQNAGQYTYTVSGQVVEMKGEGGVGILLYDKQGNIIFRSNKLKFTLPAEISTTEFSIKVINADDTEVDAINETGAAQYRKALESAIANAKVVIALSDATGTKMGYYVPEQVATLQALVDEGQKILDNNIEASYQSLYASITKETVRIQDEEEVQQVQNTGIYTLQNDRLKSRYLNGSSAALSTSTSKGEAQQWAFIATGTKDAYYLQNLKSRKFVAANINSESKISNWNAETESLAEASTFTLENAGGGSFYLKTNNVSKGNLYINCDPQGAIAVWSADAGSKWNIVRIKEIEEYSTNDIRSLISNTQALINQACEYSTSTTELSNIQTTDKTAPYYLSTNATAGIDAAHDLSKALGGLISYFSTEGATVKAKRFITLDLGKGNEVNGLQLYYRTADDQHRMKPTKITVMAADTTTALSSSVVAELTNLPSNETRIETYTSPGIYASKPARIWRFRVEESNSPNTTYPEFALSVIKFSIYSENVTLKEGYEGMDKELIANTRNTCTNVSAQMKGESTPLGNYDMYKTMESAYNKLKEAIDNRTDAIVAPQETTTDREGIYDLSGRRIESLKKGGIYIINGKKTLVK